MRYLIIILILAFSGCAHRTVYERCSAIDEDTAKAEWARYGSIERCMAEKEQASREIAEAWRNAFAPKEKIQCESRQNLLGKIETTCQR